LSFSSGARLTKKKKATAIKAPMKMAYEVASVLQTRKRKVRSQHVAT